MKKLVALLLIVAMAFALCGCASKKDAEELLELVMKNYIYDDADSWYAHYLKFDAPFYDVDALRDSKAMEKVLIKRFEDFGTELTDPDFRKYTVSSKATLVAACFDRLGYRNDNVKASFLSFLKQVREYKGDYLYYSACFNCAGMKSFATMEEVLPREELLATMTEKGHLLSLESGEFSENADQYQNSSSFHDPLGTGSKKGDVGTYTESTSYDIRGDFMIQRDSTYWAKTDDNDSHNSSKIQLIASGAGLLLTDRNEINRFFQLAEQGTVYSISATDMDMGKTKAQGSFAIIVTDEKVYLVQHRRGIVDLYG